MGEHRCNYSDVFLEKIAGHHFKKTKGAASIIKFYSRFSYFVQNQNLDLSFRRIKNYFEPTEKSREPESKSVSDNHIDSEKILDFLNLVVRRRLQSKAITQTLRIVMQIDHFSQKDLEHKILWRLIDYLYISVPEEFNQNDLRLLMSKVKSNESVLSFEDKEKVLVILLHFRNKENSQVDVVLAEFESLIRSLANEVLKSKDYCYNRIELPDQDGNLVEVQYYRSMSLDLNRDLSVVSFRP